MTQRDDMSAQEAAPQSGGSQHFRIPFPEKEVSGKLLFEGQPLNGDRMLEHFDPEFVAAYKAFVIGFFNATSLDPVIRELAIIRIGHLSACPYEVHHHVSFARNLGVPETKISSMAEPAPENLTASESAAIRFVDELVRSARPSDAALQEVRSQFSDQEVLELVMVVGNWMMGARFIETVGLPVDDFAIKGGDAPEVAVGDNDARHVVTEGLEGKIIIVSGASSGIGAATAKELASSGAQVVVADIDEKGAADTAQAIRDAGGSAISTAVDVRDDASVRKMIDVTIEHFGRIDGLHNNVADIALVVKDTTILDMETWVWERTLQTNLTGIFHIMRHALPHMLKVGGGAIVNTSSASAFSAKPVNPGYASSKAALNALTRHVASAYGRQGIRCNAIAPGAVRTEGAVAAATAMGHDVEAFYKNLRENIAHSHRDGTPEDIAAIVALLLSDRGSWINGQCISVDGGWLFR